MLDNTTKLEDIVTKENPPKLKYLIKIFIYVFNSAKSMCSIYLLLLIALSFLRPTMAFIWGKYVDITTNYSNNNKIFILIAFLIIYYVINFLCSILDNYTNGFREDIENLSAVKQNRFQEKFDTKMYEKLSKLPCEFLEIPNINDRIDRVFNFTQDAWNGLNIEIMMNGYKIVAKILSVVTIGWSLYLLNKNLCFIIILAPLPMLYTTFISEKLKFKFIKDNSKLKRKARYYEGLMLGSTSKEIKALCLHDFFYTKWKNLIDEYILKERKVQLITAIFDLISTFISSLTITVALTIAIVSMAKGYISLGYLGMSLSLINTLLSDTETLFHSIGKFVSKKNEAAMFFDLMDLDEEVKKKSIDNIEEIEMKNVSYRYPLTDKYILKNISLSIKKGEHIALVGENGAGKTSFVRILLGMTTPSKGDIYINGESSKKLNCYDSMSTVLQSPAKYYTFTVEDNVRLGDIQKNTSVCDALNNAGFSALYKDTILGKDINGAELSGGEWQKLSIARAHYRNRNFIILDEPTGNLDPIAEAEIFEKYMELSKGKTLIMVTHRISVTSLADRIIVFNKGHIVEDGTHEELLSKNGEYARLYYEQAKWYQR